MTGIFFLNIAMQFILLGRASILLFLCLLVSGAAFSQRPLFSVSTDVSLLRNFKKTQRYWALGQTLTGNFHFTGKEALYIWGAYYSNGKFTNELTAEASDTLTVPRQVNYKNHAKLRFNHISIGWKHYLKGQFNAEEKWNLYGYAGFGLLFGIVENIHSVAIDTGKYEAPVLAGKGKFKRLTLDLGLGIEIPAGGDVYFYSEGRCFVPTTAYPSQYLFNNENAPFTGSFNLGIRVLFGN